MLTLNHTGPTSYERSKEVPLDSQTKISFVPGRYYEFLYSIKAGDPNKITRSQLANSVAQYPAKDGVKLELVDWGVTQDSYLLVQVKAVGSAKTQLASTEATALALPLVSIAWAVAVIVSVITAYKITVQIYKIYELTPLPARSIAVVANSLTVPLTILAGFGLFIFWPRRKLAR